MAPYQHPFPQHPATSHTTHQQSSLSNPPYLTAQLSPFASNGLALGGSMGAASSFQVGDQTGFASQAARTGFQHAAALQQQQHHTHQQSHGQQGERIVRAGGGGGKSRIREVWKHNFEEEMAVLMDLAEDYPYIAMVGLNLGLLCSMDLLTIRQSRTPNFLES
jgi:CCR4-NOT transcription complex subunit 7/8